MRASVRRFVAGHLVAVGAIYATAVAFGGQWVEGALPEPLGPSTTVASASGQTAVRTTAPDPAARPVDEASDLVPRRYDIALPWSRDSDGHLRLSDR